MPGETVEFSLLIECGKGSMSYSICRIAKVKAGGVTGIQIHDRREKENVSHTNKDIDWTKTHENIDLLQQQERFRTVVNNRIAELELKRAPRSDATVMCQCLVTSDKEFFDKMTREEQTEYFKKSFEFIKKRYGAENLVSATIHYDERTPHMHVNFVPVTKDGRLSAKDLFSPKSLRELQNDYNRFVREQGYDLERGDHDSKKKHLEVEEYKLETKYKELKSKELELEKLKEIDTEIPLEAEKGKLVYSTKDVESIKEQNRALKLKIYKQERELKELKSNLSNVENRLLKAQNELESIKVPLARLNDLESQNRALEYMRKSNPIIDKTLVALDRLKEHAYALGNKLLDCKKLYHHAVDERERLLKLVTKCENNIKSCDNQSNDLINLDTGINNSLDQENTLRIELDGLKGIFKKKAREELLQKLELQEKITKDLTDRLQKEYGITHENIIYEIHDVSQTKHNSINEKGEIVEKIDKIEHVLKQTVYDYKYHKALSDTQQEDMGDITQRINNKISFRPGEEKIFRLTQEDRHKLLKAFEGKIEPKLIEKCKANFEKQNDIERMERQIKSIKPNLDKGWSRER